MPSYLDLGVIAIVLVSALLSMVRGFTREVLAIGSWVAAVLAALWGYSLVLPYVRPYISKEQIAIAAAAAIVFFATLIVVSIITIKLSDIILDSKIGALDRTLGFIFGSLRGFLLCIVAMGFFQFLINEKSPPDWVKNAKLKPYLDQSMESLKTLIPPEVYDQMNKLKISKPAADTPAEPAAATPAPAPAPSAADQQKLNQLAAPPKKP